MVACIVLCSTGMVIAQETSPLKEQKDKLSYSLGVNIGRSMKRDAIDANPDMVVQGIKDALAAGKMLLTDEEMAQAFTVLQQEMITKKTEARKALAEKNLKEGEKFLAENSRKEGVVTQPSGLQSSHNRRYREEGKTDRCRNSQLPRHNDRWNRV